MDRAGARRWRWRLLLVTALVVASLPVAMPASADSASGVPTASEAWYRPAAIGWGEDPLCSSPLGCPVSPALPPPPYPEDTLHVGVTAGRPDAVTYVSFATSTLPADAVLKGGTAVLPIADVADGTFAEDVAQLVACLVTEPFEAAHGAPADEAPEIRCDVSTGAVYVADEGVPRFEVDLEPFVSSLQAGSVVAFALVPTSGGTDSWHVAFSGRDREAEGAAPPITATLSYSVTPAASVGTEDSGESAPGADELPPRTSSPVSPPGGFENGRSLPEVAAPEVAERDTTSADPELVDAPAVAAPSLPADYRYRVVWLFPLALMMGGVFLSRALTGEVEVLPAGAQPDLVGRLWLAFFPGRAPTPGL